MDLYLGLGMAFHKGLYMGLVLGLGLIQFLGLGKSLLLSPAFGARHEPTPGSVHKLRTSSLLLLGYVLSTVRLSRISLPRMCLPSPILDPFIMPIQAGNLILGRGSCLELSH
jgi:hypothetical protein